ncbi:carbohydrate ABC transporter permease [Clostridiaceae bacterium OttesenSCG-928-D20]|nr:carbohydrate ABC transporter permease [Clostridiaceae bacterium OttesenSCG-928-D20]
MENVNDIKMAKKPKMRKLKQDRINAVSLPTEVLFNIILGLFSLFCILPFIFVVIISFTSEASINLKGYSFFPVEWTTSAYDYIFRMRDVVFRTFFNSVYITVIGTVLSVLVCVLYAYPLFRQDFKYRRFFNFISFFTMMFGGGLVPTYIISKNVLGLSENYAAVIVPLMFSPFNIIIMRTFFRTSVPTELIEAATIDGSGEYGTLFKIVVPVAKPGIATVALLNALAYWNEWYLPMLYITKATEKIPLQYFLMQMQRNADFLARNSSMLGAEASSIARSLPTQSLRMALVVIIVIPIACAYPFFQRYIVSGLTIGSVKG